MGWDKIGGEFWKGLVWNRIYVAGVKKKLG